MQSNKGFSLDRNENNFFHWMIRLDVNPNNFGHKPQSKRSSGLLEIRKSNIFEPHREKTCVRGHRPGLSQTGLMARGSKFRVHEAECLYYLCSEIKGAVKLCNYPSADRGLCFHIHKKQSLS